jgi:hypothetical protein
LRQNLLCAYLNVYPQYLPGPHETKAAAFVLSRLGCTPWASSVPIASLSIRFPRALSFDQH